MARFDRFEKIERAREEQPDDEPLAQTSGRFGKIEQRKDEAPKPAPDPFAPPPDDSDVPLEVAQDDVREVARRKEEKRSKAQAQIDAERQRVAEIRMRQEAGRDPLELALAKRGILTNLDATQKAYLFIGSVAVIGVLAALFGKFIWGLVPIALAIYVANWAAKRSPEE